MVRDCAASASSLLGFTRRHFVAITLHAETNFIGDLFFIFAAFYVKALLSGLFVKGSTREGAALVMEVEKEESLEHLCCTAL